VAVRLTALEPKITEVVNRPWLRVALLVGVRD